MKINRFLTPIFCFLLGIPAVVHSQITTDNVRVDSTQTVEIILNNNQRYTGTILSVNNDELELQTDSGRMYIQLSRIESIREAGSAGGWFENPNKSRLFFSPTARPLKKGDGYYQNIYVFFSNAAYAVSHNISFTGGFSMVPGISISEQLLMFSGKFGAEVAENHYAGGGIAVATIAGSGENLLVGYGNYTYDFGRGNFTGGLSTFGLTDEVGTFAILLGGDYRLSERIAMVTENFWFPEVQATLFSYGLRFMGERMSVDLAFFRPGITEDIGFGIPYVDFVFNF